MSEPIVGSIFIENGVYTIKTTNSDININAGTKNIMFSSNILIDNNTAGDTAANIIGTSSASIYLGKDIIDGGGIKYNQTTNCVEFYRTSSSTQSTVFDYSKDTSIVNFHGGISVDGTTTFTNGLLITGNVTLDKVIIKDRIIFPNATEQTFAYTDADRTNIETNTFKTQYMSVTTIDHLTTFDSDIIVKNDIVFRQDDLPEFYGRIGNNLNDTTDNRLNIDSSIFGMLLNCFGGSCEIYSPSIFLGNSNTPTELHINNEIQTYAYTDADKLKTRHMWANDGSTYFETNIAINGAVIINDEFQSYAYTDADKIDVNSISTISSDLNLLEVSVGQNISRLDALEETKILQQAFLNWSSVNGNAIPWNNGNHYSSVYNCNIGTFFTSYFDVNKKWMMGNKKMRISIEANFYIPECFLKKLQSSIRITNNSNTLRDNTFYQGYDYINAQTDFTSVTYDASIVIVLNNGDSVFVDTQYDIQTAQSNASTNCLFRAHLEEF